MTSIPETNLAVVIQPDRSFAVERIPVLKPGPGEVLVKVHAVAPNPSEWRANTYSFVKAGTVTGSDVAGEIIAIGEGSHEEQFAIGDRVAAFVQGAFTPRYAAFREYTVLKSSPLLRIPPNISYEEASSIPLTASTAVLGLARLFNFPDLPPLGRSILIWGGSSSLGFYAIQLARLVNLHVITTASPKNFEAVKEHGAHSVIDYLASDVVEQIRKASPHGDGLISRWLENGKFKPNPITVRPGGLYGIPEGIQYMMMG
ncbi:chaperonin 10-like protein, partial [Cyathus striatus]